MNSAYYSDQIKEFMLDHVEHSQDFKILVLRLLSLHNKNVKLVSAITYVPEVTIMEWNKEWNRRSSMEYKLNKFKSD